MLVAAFMRDDHGLKCPLTVTSPPRKQAPKVSLASPRSDEGEDDQEEVESAFDVPAAKPKVTNLHAPCAVCEPSSPSS